MTKQETIEEITRRLVEFYHPVRIYLLVPKPGVTPARTAISIFVWSCLTMRRRASTATAAYMGGFGAWRLPWMSFESL